MTRLSAALLLMMFAACATTSDLDIERERLAKRRARDTVVDDTPRKTTERERPRDGEPNKPEAEKEAPRAPAPGAGVPPRKASLDPETTLSVHLLDVGQGAATLFEFPCGAMLIDTGGELNSSFDGRVALMTQLDAFFARRADLERTIDVLVITHPHIDHMRGLPKLLESVQIKTVIDNGNDGDDLVRDEARALRSYIDDNLVKQRRVRVDDIVKRNGMTDDAIDPIACAKVDPKIRVLWGGLSKDPGWGTDNYGKARFANQNNHSVVTRVDFGAASVLITGDLEDIAIHSLINKYEGTRWLDVDIYQAGHHGSRNGTTRELLTAMTPSIALIAMGDSARQHSWTAWAYGHPRADIVEMLEDRVRMKRARTEVPVGKGVKRFQMVSIDRAIYGTGWDGAVAIDITVDGEFHIRTRR